MKEEGMEDIDFEDEVDVDVVIHDILTTHLCSECKGTDCEDCDKMFDGVITDILDTMFGG